MLCFACLLAIPFTLVAADRATTRYLEPVPDIIPVIETSDQLSELATLHPLGSLDDRNGGYYLLGENDEVLAVVSDELCKKLDASMESAMQVHARDNLLKERKGGGGGGHGGKGGHGKGKPKSKPMPPVSGECSHKLCKKNQDCVNYKDCHACSTKDHWCY